ncbi:MAG: MBL fold metallo-hydrolase, partial [Clostridia bacterium]|nr:MBL fold metallo-hydrolase [Clostridia bacterium]
VILQAIRDAHLKVERILLTHGHVDHVSAVEAIAAETGAPVFIHPDDEALMARSCRHRPDGYLGDGDEVPFAGGAFRVLHTPGHTPGGVCFYWPDDRVCFSGDTLFAGSIGRTDLPGGSHQTLLASIRTRLLVLPDDVLVYPGHGPQTTIGEERRTNPFLV